MMVQAGLVLYRIKSNLHNYFMKINSMSTVSRTNSSVHLIVLFEYIKKKLHLDVTASPITNPCWTTQGLR